MTENSYGWVSSFALGMDGSLLVNKSVSGARSSEVYPEVQRPAAAGFIVAFYSLMMILLIKHSNPNPRRKRRQSSFCREVREWLGKEAGD